MTSANVTNYRICDRETGKVIGQHSQHAYCHTHWGDLLVFTPPENYTITPYGLDEEEEEWEGDTINLKDFIDMLKKSKYVKFNTMNDLMDKYKSSQK
jgi:hypothetical protein